MLFRADCIQPEYSLLHMDLHTSSHAHTQCASSFFFFFFFFSAQHFMHASMFITTVTMFSSTHAHTCHNLANQQCTHTRKETGWVQSPPPPKKNVFSSSEKKCLTNNIIIDHQYNISKEKIIPVAANSSKDNKCQQFGWRF